MQGRHVAQRGDGVGEVPAQSLQRPIESRLFPLGLRLLQVRGHRPLDVCRHGARTLSEDGALKDRQHRQKPHRSRERKSRRVAPHPESFNAACGLHEGFNVGNARS